MDLGPDADVWQLFAAEECSSPVEAPAVDLCDYCGATDIAQEDGHWVCRACSSLVSQVIDAAPEWRSFGSGEDGARTTERMRCAPPYTAHDGNILPTSLGSRMWCGGRAAASTTQRAVQRYHMWNAMSYRERALFSVFDQLAVNAAQSGITPCIVTDAKVIYKRFMDARAVCRVGRQALIASSMYLACKANGVPRSVKEIASIVCVDSSDITKGCRIFQEMAVQDQQGVKAAGTHTSTPEDFVGRFCSRLSQDDAFRDLCRHVVRRVDEYGVIRDGMPTTIVAGVMQLCNVALGLGLSRQQLSDACHISAATIGKCYKRLSRHQDLLLPPDMDTFKVKAVRVYAQTGPTSPTSCEKASL